MLGSTLLDVLIGIVFVYLFLSLINAVLTESISNLFKIRSTNLEQWIRNALEGHGEDGDRGVFAEVRQWLRGLWPLSPKREEAELTRDFFGHPLIKGIMQDGRKPSYIPTRTFSLALLDVIAPIDPQKGARTLGELRDSVNRLPDNLKKIMLVHLDAAQNDLNAVRQNVETWFDQDMERVAGWYKRKSQAIVLALSLVITIGLNVDTLALATRLYSDSALRAALVASAAEITKEQLTPGESSQGKLDQINEQIKKMQFPLGWSSVLREARSKPGITPRQEGGGTKAGQWIDDFRTAADTVDLMTIIGWIITTLAVSLGAPFWFDTLGKIINIRNAGIKPKTAEKAEKPA